LVADLCLLKQTEFEENVKLCEKFCMSNTTYIFKRDFIKASH